jgi:transposase
MKALAENIVNNVKQQLRQGKSAREVASNLNVSISSAIKIRNADKENIPAPKMGRPSKISNETRRNMARQFNSGVLKSLRDGQLMVQSADGGLVHTRTVQRLLKKEGVKAYVQQKKPCLTLNHNADRLQFAKAHLHWTVEQWSKVMFSDETTISRVGSFGKKFYYSSLLHKRLKPHQVKGTKQGGGGKIMVWGCMTYHGVGDASWISGRINAEAYIDVLKDYVLASRDWYDMDPETFIFQQDNASVHTAHIVKAFFAESNLTVMKWPANSPDLNPIEHLWSYLKTQLNAYKEDPKTMDELWERVQEVWTKIPTDYIHKLYESMPRRMEEVIRNRGGNTKY